MVKATTGLQSNVLLSRLSKQSLWFLSFQRFNTTDLYIHFFIPLVHWVHLCVHLLLHKSTMKPEPYVCSLFAPHDCVWCCLELKRHNLCCFFSLGTAEEDKASSKSIVSSLSKRYPSFSLWTLIWSIQLLFVLFYHTIQSSTATTGR